MVFIRTRLSFALILHAHTHTSNRNGGDRADWCAHESPCVWFCCGDHRKGWKNGTKITYEKEGDELPGVIPADIIFILNTKPHPRFERDGNDLVYTATVPLADALTGVKVDIQTLDGRTIT